jgi:hypothetical protein
MQGKELKLLLFMIFYLEFISKVANFLANFCLFQISWFGGSFLPGFLVSTSMVINADP